MTGNKWEAMKNRAINLINLRYIAEMRGDVETTNDIVLEIAGLRWEMARFAKNHGLVDSFWNFWEG